MGRRRGDNLLSNHLTELIHILKEHVVVGHGPEQGYKHTQQGNDLQRTSAKRKEE